MVESKPSQQTASRRTARTAQESGAPKEPGIHVRTFPLSEPHTWLRGNLEEALAGIEIERGSQDWHDYKAAKGFIKGCYSGDWVPDESNYRRLIEWICDYLNL